MIVVTVNGERRTLEGLDPSMPLLWALRDHLNLVGAKFGCGIAQCGACTVLVDGRPVRSCQLSLESAAGSSVTTIEGLASGTGELHPLQEAWIAHDVPQCGYCQAGQILTAASLLEANPAPSDAEIDAAMAGNLCRCGTYLRIRKAIQSVAGGTQEETA